MLEQNLVDFSSDDGSLFFYKGSFSKRPSMAISHIVEDFISSRHLGKVKRKTLFFLIEITQNIEKYSHHDDIIKDWFLAYSKPGNIIIESQNVVHNQYVAGLRKKLELIDESSQDELKEMFTEKLSKSLTEDKKSPGLGFIELKRKNKRSFEFEFEQIDEFKSAFRLKVLIDDLSNEESEKIIVDYNLVDCIKKDLANEKEIIIYSGDLSGSQVAPVVNLIEKIEFSEDLVFRSKYQHALIELLQNSKEHSVEVDKIKSGFFIVKKQDNAIIVSCCNKAESYEGVQQEINRLNNSSKSELEVLSKKALLNFEVEGGLGLIQVANLCHPSPLISKTFYNSLMQTFLYIESSYLN